MERFIDQYNWKEEKRLEKFELNNKSVALYVLYVPYNTEKKDMHTRQNII